MRMIRALGAASLFRISFRRPFDVSCSDTPGRPALSTSLLCVVHQCGLIFCPCQNSQNPYLFQRRESFFFSFFHQSIFLFLLAQPHRYSPFYQLPFLVNNSQSLSISSISEINDSRYSLITTTMVSERALHADSGQ